MSTPEKKFEVYVACALTHATKEFRDMVERFKKKLGDDGICVVLCFYGLNKPGITPNEVYRWDIHQCVYKSHLVVAIVDLPSTGLGYEIATQVEARKMPCLMLAHNDAKVSDLILDMQQRGCEFKRYNDLMADGIELVIDKLSRCRKHSWLKRLGLSLLKRATSLLHSIG